MEKHEAKDPILRLKLIADGSYRLRIDDQDKRFIRSECKRLGIDFTPRQGCKSCYQDAAIQILVERKKREQEAEELEKEAAKVKRKYALRAGLDLIWRGQRVNALTSEAKLKELLDAGFPANFMYIIDGVVYNDARELITKTDRKHGMQKKIMADCNLYESFL